MPSVIKPKTSTTLIGVQYTRPKFKRNDLVEDIFISSRLKYGVGVVLKRKRFKGPDKHLYTIYWTKSKTKSDFSEPRLRRARSNKENG